MKIYFDGCSWTYGTELENPEQERFSKLICDHYGAEETNKSIPGGSNDRIVRQLLTETDISQYDLGIIQMTHPSRTEFYSKKCWIPMNIGQNYRSWNLQETENNILERFSWWRWGEQSEMDALKNAWKEYYIHIVTKEFLHNKEIIHNLTIRDHFKSKGVPLFLMTINHNTEIKEQYDLDAVFNKPYPLAPGGHLNKEGHQMIADEIIKMIEDENLL